MVTMPTMGVSSVRQEQVSSLVLPLLLAMWLDVDSILWNAQYSSLKMASD